nr:MAG TPA: hypothetical protein [Inoviridae sp.]
MKRLVCLLSNRSTNRARYRPPFSCDSPTPSSLPFKSLPIIIAPFILKEALI